MDVQVVGVAGAGFMGSGIAGFASREDIDNGMKLKRMVVAGHHGRKSGRGFDEHPPAKEAVAA
jgi:3-hydroxyacyl-CoA dehydrogenase